MGLATIRWTPWAHTRHLSAHLLKARPSISITKWIILILRSLAGCPTPLPPTLTSSCPPPPPLIPPEKLCQGLSPSSYHRISLPGPQALSLGPATRLEAAPKVDTWPLWPTWSLCFRCQSRQTREAPRTVARWKVSVGTCTRVSKGSNRNKLLKGPLGKYLSCTEANFIVLQAQYRPVLCMCDAYRKCPH